MRNLDSRATFVRQMIEMQGGMGDDPGNVTELSSSC
jgi:hypothetical protein